MRFLFYAVASMTYLEGLLYDRAAVVWHSRDLRYVRHSDIWRNAWLIKDGRIWAHL